jgi:hypothetical protein
LADHRQSQRRHSSRPRTYAVEDLRSHKCHLTDPTRDMAFTRLGDDLVDGLFVELDAWQWHLFRIDTVTEQSLL